MRQWLIPALALLIVGGAGIGVGWSINEWQDGEEAPVPTEEPAAPTQTGPTQAEIEAERQREEDRLCLEAEQAAAASEMNRAAAIEAEVNRLQQEFGWSANRARVFASITVGGGVPEGVQDAIDRYC